MRLVSRQPGRHRFHRQHFIDLAGRRRALWHPRQSMAVILGLSQGQSTPLLDGRHPQRSITPGPREDDADGVFTLIVGERLEEGVYRPTAIARRRGFDDLQACSVHRHRGVGRDHEDGVGRDRDAIGRLDDPHRGGPAEQLGQHALVVRRQMLNEHKRHAGVRRATREEILERLKPPRRRANADDQGRDGIGYKVAWRTEPLAGLRRRRRFGGLSCHNARITLNSGRFSRFNSVSTTTLHAHH